MGDLTIIYLTANRFPLFKQWEQYHRKILLEAVGDRPLITISKVPMDLPGVNLLDTGKRSSYNYYCQILRGAKEAKTPFIAIAEDDVLYTRDHFDFFRPPLDTFAYNANHWQMFSWGEPTYFYKKLRISACFGIFPREETISAFEERFAKWPNGIPHEFNGEPGHNRFEKKLGVTLRKTVHYYSPNPGLQICHEHCMPEDGATEADTARRAHRRKMGSMRAFDIPYWRMAEDLVRNFK